MTAHPDAPLIALAAMCETAAKRFEAASAEYAEPNSRSRTTEPRRPRRCAFKPSRSMRIRTSLCRSCGCGHYPLMA
jgi:hypothetical protein